MYQKEKYHASLTCRAHQNPENTNTNLCSYRICLALSIPSIDVLYRCRMLCPQRCPLTFSHRTVRHRIPSSKHAHAFPIPHVPWPLQALGHAAWHLYTTKITDNNAYIYILYILKFRSFPFPLIFILFFCPSLYSVFLGCGLRSSYSLYFAHKCGRIE